MIFTTPFLPIDALSFLMLILIAAIFPLIIIYSLSYIKRNLFRYYLLLSITLIGLIGAVLAKDFLSFYIFLEIMTVGIYFLIIDNTKKESFPAGFKYILMMFAAGIFILIATLMLYNLTGTFDMAQIHKMLPTLSRGSLLLVFTLFTIGCLIQIGAVPFHIWLPDAHPVAPSPISALLSGVVIKVGAYGIIRMIFALDILSYALIISGIFSMLFGVAMALRQTNVKRLLAYHSISQMGYILLGIGIGTSLGMAGAMFHMINHAVFKSLLFLCMGCIIYATGERMLNKLGGLGKYMPTTMITCGIAALAICGIPPLNGFASKALIFDGVAHNLLFEAAIILTGAATIASFIKLFRFTFLGSLPEKIKNVRRVPLPMLIPLIILAALCLLLGIFPNQVLAKLISPALFQYGTGLTFDFWNIHRFTETILAGFLGVGIYLLGLKTGFLGMGKKIVLPSFTRYLSLDRIVCGCASLFEKGCAKFRELQTESLNAYLGWAFLTLIIFILLLRFVIV